MIKVKFQQECGVHSLCTLEERVAVGLHSGTIKLYADGAELGEFAGRSSVRALCGSGQQLYSGSFDGFVNIWDVREMRNIGQFQAHRRAVSAICKNGNQLVTASYGGAVRIWDTRNMRLLTTLYGHHVVTSACIKNNTIYVGASHKMKKWRSRRFRGFQQTMYDMSVWSMCVDNSGDNVYAGTINGDLVNCTTLESFNAHTNAIKSMCALGNRVVSGSDDKLIKIWSTDADHDVGKAAATFHEHSRSVTALASIGNEILVSGSSDKNVIIWKIPANL